ncbi:hypothetical protein K402DRAFT_421430 [Aulographum hederae CBS 113979]|uniref:Cora-domain-containing protein n=1 Tax=Aulographum hederae CBS 113979 TaxID=1176131 RepID=A0A6G1GZP0_9PEZI|nr:hypothetical protein K402DRAFT_421430 [Aulographum hederae CBS 113979]
MASSSDAPFHSSTSTSRALVLRSSGAGAGAGYGERNRIVVEDSGPGSGSRVSPTEGREREYRRAGVSDEEEEDEWDYAYGSLPIRVVERETVSVRGGDRDREREMDRLSERERMRRDKREREREMDRYSERGSERMAERLRDRERLRGSERRRARSDETGMVVREVDWDDDSYAPAPRERSRSDTVSGRERRARFDSDPVIVVHDYPYAMRDRSRSRNRNRSPEVKIYRQRSRERYDDLDEPGVRTDEDEEEMKEFMRRRREEEDGIRNRQDRWSRDDREVDRLSDIRAERRERMRQRRINRVEIHQPEYDTYSLPSRSEFDDRQRARDELRQRHARERDRERRPIILPAPLGSAPLPDFPPPRRQNSYAPQSPPASAPLPEISFDRHSGPPSYVSAPQASLPPPPLSPRINPFAPLPPSSSRSQRHRSRSRSRRAQRPSPYTADERVEDDGHGQYWDQLSDISETPSDSSFGFTIPRDDQSSDPGGEANGGAGNGNGGKKPPSETGTLGGAPGFRYEATPLRVLESRANVDESAYFVTSADLSVVPEATIPKIPSTPLFRWVHLQNPLHNSMAFLEQTIAIPGLTEGQKHVISITIGKMQNDFERELRTPQGSNGKTAVPHFVHGAWEPTDGPHPPAEELHAHFLMLPYFCLDRYTPPNLPANSNHHPTIGLVQALISSANRERELQQAVTALPDTPKGHCFHIAQLWCLVLEDGLIVTCSQLDLAELRDSTVNFNPRPDPPTNTEPYIIITDNNRTWSLPTEGCKTWFTFAAHFYDLNSNFENFLQVSWKGETITPEMWPRIYAQAKRTTLHLQLNRKKRGNHRDVLVDWWPLPVRQDQHGPPNPPPSPPPPPPPDSPPAPRPRPRRRSTDFSELSIDLFVNSPPTQAGADDSDGSDRRQSRSATRGRARSLSRSRTPSPNRENRRGASTRDESGKIKTFSVFSWLAMKNDTPRQTHRSSSLGNAHLRDFDTGPEIDSEKMTSHLRLAHQFLWDNPRAKEQRVYRQMAERSMAEVEAWCDRNEWGSVGASVNLKRQEVLQAAKDNYLFYAPEHADGLAVRRYWGAVQKILEDINGTSVPLNYQQSTYELRRLARGAIELTKTISKGIEEDADKIKVPDEFVKAWPHCIMYLCFLAGKEVNEAKRHMNKIMDLTEQGIWTLFETVVKKTLRTREVCMPLTIMALLSSRLVHDISRGQPNLRDSYWEYFKRLEAEVRQDPLKRSHQNKLGFLTQELDSITTVLRDQHRVLDSLYSSSYGKMDRSNQVFTHSVEPEVDDMAILRNSLALVSNRLEDFREIKERVGELERWNIRMIDSNKDRQDAAIYAFTIVTVIFLPLTAVSGFLGMNTSDIRDMPQPQWVFWAAGVPLTVVIILISLYWAGELGNAWGWVATPLLKMLPRVGTAGRRRRMRERGYREMKGGSTEKFKTTARVRTEVSRSDTGLSRADTDTGASLREAMRRRPAVGASGVRASRPVRRSSGLGREFSPVPVRRRTTLSSRYTGA